MGKPRPTRWGSPINVDSLMKKAIHAGIFEPKMDFINLKARNSKLIDKLHVGIQCGSCGERHLSRSEYSQHLDKHFRANRLAKEKKIYSRKWYLKEDDWIKFDDSDYVEYTSVNPFEQPNEQIDSVCSISASGLEVDKCPHCLETFEEFFDQDEEEWKIRNAVCVGEALFHVPCSHQ